jgi:hypothetical protein
MGACFASPGGIPPASPAGTVVLFDPGPSDVELGLLVLTTDVAQWITLSWSGQSGQPGQVAMPVYVGPGGASFDLRGQPLSAFGAAGRQITATTSVASGLGWIVTGRYLP